MIPLRVAVREVNEIPHPHRDRRAAGDKVKQLKLSPVCDDTVASRQQAQSVTSGLIVLEFQSTQIVAGIKPGDEFVLTFAPAPKRVEAAPEKPE